MKVSFVSLGCDKNLSDSEHMLYRLQKAGIEITSEESEADVIVVNTCCFIESALQESIDTVLEMAKYKEEGNLKGLLIAGCMSERYRDEIEKDLPEVDGILGTNSYDEEDLTNPCAFLIGNEGNGLRREIADMADCYVKIPMLGQVESLNAAIASSVLMFEAARQRRKV